MKEEVVLLKAWTQSAGLFLRAVSAALLQSFGRMTLWFGCHGIVLPWSEWAETIVSPQTLERYRRRALVSRLRVQRYRVTRGPFFIRSSVDRFFVLLRFFQFPVYLVSKLGLALLICLLPFILFFSVRVYLPVEQRVVRRQASLPQSTFRTSEAVVPSAVLLHSQTTGTDTPAAKFSSVESASSDTFFDFRTLDARTGEGILIQGRGSAHEEVRRGWRFGSGSELLLRFPQRREPTTIRFRIRPIPVFRASVQCNVTVTNDSGKVLFGMSFDTQTASRNAFLKSPLTRGLQEKLMPEFASTRATLLSSPVTLNMSAGENHLRLQMAPADKEVNGGDCSALVHGFEWSGASASASSKRSLLLMLFRSLNATVAMDPEVMPWMSSFLNAPNTLQFLQHHALDVRGDQSWNSLLGMSLDQGAAHPHLIEKLRNKGYRVVFLGHVDAAEEQITRFLPDLTIRIGNQVYEPQLVLSQLLKVLEEESSTPLLVITRLRGMSRPWRPSASDLELKELFFGGSQRGLMDAVLFSLLRTLDRELRFHFEQIRESGVLKKMDVIVSSEKGFDLGLNPPVQDEVRPTFTEDLLVNEETLRVPLGVLLADAPQEASPVWFKAHSVVSTHSDLARTVWESLGVTDAKFTTESRRMWTRGMFSSQSRGGPAFGLRETDFVMRVLPLRSRLQDGVLFADPEASSGFLKYVSQSVNRRIHAPEARGFSLRKAMDLPAGEQFRQVSRRGQREETVFLVNSRFVREARRITRHQRQFPLHLKMNVHGGQRINLLLEETTEGETKIGKSLAPSLTVSSKRIDARTIVHHIQGDLADGESVSFRDLSLQALRFVENKGESALVACPEAYIFTPQALSASLAQKTVCLLEQPSEAKIKALQNLNRKVISFRLVEDENQICTLLEDKQDEDFDYAECLESTSRQAGSR
jgi:hypothetical protein